MLGQWGLVRIRGTGWWPGLASYNGTETLPLYSHNPSSLSLESQALLRLPFSARRWNPDGNNRNGTLTSQLLQPALFPHIPAAPRNHGCPPMLRLVVLNSSHLQHHLGPVQRTLKTSKSNVRSPVTCVFQL